MHVWPETRLGSLLKQLEAQHGRLTAPQLAGPFAMVLWEIVGYMADDARRGAAFAELQRRVGISPEKIIEAPLKLLAEVTRMGGAIACEERAARLRIAARLVLERHGGDLSSVLKLPVSKAKKALMEFPMIGEPGAEKILLFCGALKVLALESNGLRTLTRVGFGRAAKSYSATYKSVREATLEGLPADPALLGAAFLLLRKHGQQICRHSEPQCSGCPVSGECAHAVAARR